MKKFILPVLLITSFSFYGQISLKDSTVQVIGYWDINDTQSFEASYQKYKVKDSDTTYTMKVGYDIDVTVKDSSANSYTIEWLYKNYKIETDDPIIKKISTVAENLSVLFKTDELGVFIEVINWEEIKIYIEKSISIIKEEYKDVPYMGKILDQTAVIYNSKEAIEANAIKDIVQFYNFHGLKYKLGETLTGNIETRNNFGGKPFDTEVEYSLDEINAEDGNAVFRMRNTIDSKQLTKATYAYLKKMAETLGQKDLNVADLDIPPLTNETWIASRIHGSTGWVIYSVLTKEVTADSTTNVEETIIEIK